VPRTLLFQSFQFIIHYGHKIRHHAVWARGNIVTSTAIRVLSPPPLCFKTHCHWPALFYDCLSNVVFTSFRLVDLRIIYRQWLTVNLTASQQPAMCQVKHETPSLKTCAGTMWRLVRVIHEYGAVVEW